MIQWLKTPATQALPTEFEPHKYGRGLAPEGCPLTTPAVTHKPHPISCIYTKVTATFLIIKKQSGTFIISLSQRLESQPVIHICPGLFTVL